jgi:hypothetical protein
MLVFAAAEDEEAALEGQVDDAVAHGAAISRVSDP